MYTIDERKFETAEEVAQYVIDNADLICEYDQLLDECYEDVTMGKLSYAPSEVLHKVDEVAYHCGYLEYVDGLYSDMVYELERMSNGDTFFAANDYEIVYTEEQE